MVIHRSFIRYISLYIAIFSNKERLLRTLFFVLILRRIVKRDKPIRDIYQTISRCIFANDRAVTKVLTGVEHGIRVAPILNDLSGMMVILRCLRSHFHQMSCSLTQREKATQQKQLFDDQRHLRSTAVNIPNHEFICTAFCPAHQKIIDMAMNGVGCRCARIALASTRLYVT